MENKSIIIDFPIKLLKFELKEYLEYNFKVYIKQEDKDIIVFGNPVDLAICQEHADYFKSVDTQFLLHLNKDSKESLSISNLKLYFQSKCKVLMSIDNDVLYIFGQLYNVTCVYNYLCHCTDMIEQEINFDFNESEETELNLMCRNSNIKLPDFLSKDSKIFIYFTLKHRETFFSQFDEYKYIESMDLSLRRENLNIISDQANENIIPEESTKFLETSENDATSLLLPNQDRPTKYRTVIIDGSNVALEHGRKSVFSALGIKIAVDYFLDRGHTRVYALLPRHRQPHGGALFAQMELADHLKYTPSRIINKVRETPYDGRFILDAAIATDGIVLSNGQYRDLMSIDKYEDIICTRLISYSFVEDHIIIPNDPRGFNGPSLTSLLVYSDRSLKKFSKRQKKLNRTKSLPTSPKTNTNSRPAQRQSPQSDMSGPQTDLYNKACDILPSHGPIIESVILGNPEVTDLNTLVNFVIMAVTSK